MQTSDTDNWSRLDSLVTHSRQVLQNVFKQRWFRCTGSTWDDTPQSSTAFLRSPFGKTFRSQNKTQMQYLAQGNTNEWNIPMLAAILITWTIPTPPSVYQFIEIENQFVRSVRHIRNVFVHLPSKQIDDATFKQHYAILISSLQKLGDDPNSTSTQVPLTESIPSSTTKPLVTVVHVDSI